MNKILLFDNSNAGTSSVEFYTLGLQVFARVASMLRFLGMTWGEFEMIKIIAYKLLQSYQLSGSPRFACHKRCLYMIILIALNDNDDDHHHHLCCLLRFSRSGTQSVRMCKEHAEPFSPPTQWRKRMLCVHVLVSWSKVDSSESAI